MRLTAFTGMLSLTVALGALVVGRAVLVPEMAAPSVLVDANLAKALAAPLHMRLAEIVLAAHLLLAAVAGRWLAAKWGTTLALILVISSALHRFLLLPALYGAWSRADVVAARPVEQILTAHRYEIQELVVVGVMVVLQVSMLVAATRLHGRTLDAVSTSQAQVQPQPMLAATQA